MTQSIRFSRTGKEVVLAIDDHVELHSSAERIELPTKIPDFTAAVADALQHPIDYPPIAGGIVPGDVVAIVIDTDVPHPELAVAGAIQAIVPCEPLRVDVVVSEAASLETQGRLRASLPPEIELTVHCGKSRDELRYLAANEAADPIYLNRRVVDADLVVPITISRHSDPLFVRSTFGAVFPSLADHAAQSRARLHPEDLNTTYSTSGTITKRRLDADDDALKIDWLLGLQWLVTVDMTDDGQPGKVCAGTPERLAQRAQDREANLAVPFQSDVVVACVEGDEQQQTIANVLRAALVASGHAAVDGSIVIVCDLDVLGSLSELEQWEESMSVDDRDNHESQDAEEEQNLEQSSASERSVEFTSPSNHALRTLSVLINEASSAQRFLLLSNCDTDELESFGFGVIENSRSLERLINSKSSCAVIRSAQFASIPVAMERM